MEYRFIDMVYQTVIGEMEDGCALPGVEDSFAPGSICDRAYDQMRCAYQRLLDRLGKEDEDHDLETIVHTMEIIQKEIAYQMYRYGVHFGVQDRLI